MLAAAMAACTGDGTGPAAPATTAPAADVAPEDLPVTDVEPPAPGRARVVLGSDVDAVLDVRTCVRDLAAEPDGEVPSEQVVVEAEGRSGAERLTLDLRRYRSRGASPTITDTIRVTVGPEDAPTRVVEAQRFEVDGLVTDPRDENADAPLLRVSEGRIEARGVFAPPGAFAPDGGLVEGLVSISCGG